MPIVSSTSLLDQSDNIFFLRQLPFFLEETFSRPSTFHHIPVSRGFLFINPSSPSLLNSLVSDPLRYRETHSPTTPEHSDSSGTEVTLSPTLPPLVPVDPFDWLFINSFDNLTVQQQSQQELSLRLQSVRTLLDNISSDLIVERDQAIDAINRLTASALAEARRRLIPEIERLENILRRRD